MKITYKILPFLILIFSISVIGQTNAAIEKELVEHAKKIHKWSNYGGDSNPELLDKENAIFRKKLLKFASTRPSMIRYKFSELEEEYIYISTSPDKRFRIYSWDTGTGGTMHFFDNVYQFIGKDGKIHAKSNDYEEGESIGAYYTDIYSLKTRRGSVYLANSRSQLSTSYRGENISLFEINKNSLVDDVKLIKTRSGLTNSLGFAFDIFSLSDMSKQPAKLFQFNRKSKTIKFPVVIENKKFPQGQVTNRWIKYRFNGRYFVKVKR